jgi:hypothetical protein
LRNEHRAGEQILGGSAPKILVQYVGPTHDGPSQAFHRAPVTFDIAVEESRRVAVPLQRNTAAPSDDRSKVPMKDQVGAL